MSKIYVGQDVTLTLDAGIDVTGATLLEIRYIKPGESTPVTGGTATPSDTTASLALTPAILDTSGGWRFYIYMEKSSKVYIGETFKYDVTAVGL